MIRYHIVTAATRLKNLPEVLHSIQVAMEGVPNIEAIWHICFDCSAIGEDNLPMDFDPELDNLTIKYYKNFKRPDSEHCRGGPPKNVIFDNIDPTDDGFVHMIDDDNIVHPNFYKTITPYLQEERWDCIVYSAMFANNHPRLISIPENMHQCGVDTAQIIFSRKSLGDKRLEEIAGEDGPFVEFMVNNYKTKYLPTEFICYWNYIS